VAVTKYLWSIDPGLSTGLAFLSYEDDAPPVLEGARQFRGGANGLREWILDFLSGWDGEGTVIAEKFNARNTKGFAYTTASLEPLRCEGVLLAYDLPTAWVQPPQQYIAGGDGKADKKKRQHKFLKDTGFYRTGKDLNAPDADDFRSAAAHALGYLARTGHKPTFDLIAGWET
jgi:hypothetical protein